jgi:prepilin peptidase CpaA
MAHFPLILVICWSASFLLLAASAFIDLKDRILPNELVAAVAFVGFAQILIAKPQSIWLSLLAGLVVFCGLGVLSHYRIIGGGDLKLITAVTFLVSPDRVAQLLLGIAIAGGLLGAFYLGAHYRMKQQSASFCGGVEGPPAKNGLSNLIRAERSRIAAGDSLPYGLAILGGFGIFIAMEFCRCSYVTSYLL